MSAYDRWKSTVMYYLKNYNTIKACEELRREEILEASNFELELSGVRGSGTSDPTSKTALKLAEKNEDMRWIKLIDIVLDTHGNEFASKCIREKFDLNKFKTNGKEARYLDIISEKTYYRYQHEIINEIARRYESLCIENDRKMTENHIKQVV